MAKTKNSDKSKMIVRELAPKMKIIEPEAKTDESGEQEEASLEDLTEESPASASFSPDISMNRTPLTIEREPEVQTTSGTTQAENNAAVKYEIQRNVSEKEIKKVYSERVSETMQSGSRALVLTSPNPRTQARDDLFRNWETESTMGAGSDEERPYEITPERKAQSTARRDPWEG